MTNIDLSNQQPAGVEHLVPHRRTMSLLSRLVEVDADQATAEVDITPVSLFARDHGVPAWVGIEYMAQTIAAWAGARARNAGREPGIGFLLGSRRYSSELPHFAFGHTLRVTARCELIGDNGLGQFACRISDASTGQAIAEAMVSVFEPPDAQSTDPEPPNPGPNR
jgi:predicted hotdog family 3-hydroxylacyl-ACP dehydratase